MDGRIARYSTSRTVIAGSLTIEVLEDLDELRHDLDHDEDQDADGHADDDDRVDQRAFDLALQDCDRSWNSARRRRITSRAPPASPALIMLTYSRSKALGCLPMASESVAPDSISSQTSIRLFFSRPGLLLAFEDSQAAKNRQAGVLQDGKLPGEGGQRLGVDAADGEGSFFLPLFFFSAAALRAFLTEIFVTKYPICRIVACASSSLALRSGP